jgi:hypothetical protein
MRVLILVVGLGSLSLTACAVDKQLAATGGSRSDGIVELSYEIGDFQTAKIDWAKADLDAAQRCNAWNYQSAERFDGGRRTCQLIGDWGCDRWFVTINYQCTNAVKTAGAA